MKVVEGYKNAKSYFRSTEVKYKDGIPRHGPAADGDDAALSVGRLKCVLVLL